MKRGLRWFAAGALVTVGALVAGCPEEVTYSDAGRPAPAKARDYLFPPSSTATYLYAQTTTRWWPNQPQPEVSTSSLRLKAIRATDTEAVLVAQLVDGPADPALAALFTATISLKVAEGGAITSTVTTVLGPSTPNSYTDAALTSKGATIYPASGSAPAQVWTRTAKETVTVPAGTYETIKVRQTEGSKKAPKEIWLAKGMGLAGIKQTETATASWDDGSTSTTSTEVVLKSFTP